MRMMMLSRMPEEMLCHISRNLSIGDIFNLMHAYPDELSATVRQSVFRDFRALVFNCTTECTQVEFVRRQSAVESRLNTSDSIWTEAVLLSRKVRGIELNITRGVSTTAVFNAIPKDLRLKSLKIRLVDGKETIDRRNRLNKNLLNLVNRHANTLHHFEATSSSATVSMDINHDEILLNYSSNDEQLHSHIFVYNLFHAILKERQFNKLTLKINNTTTANAHLALQRAFQIAMPHSNRRHLTDLTIDFDSIREMAQEDELKSILTSHIDEFHYTTPNLRQFTCHLPHSDISLSDISNSIKQMQKPQTRCEFTAKSIVIGKRAISIKC